MDDDFGDDDDFGADEEFLAALAASEAEREASRPAHARPPRPNNADDPQPPARRIQQPTPQPLARRLQQQTPHKIEKSAQAPKIVQPVPQALPQKSSTKPILVSPRQKGNPVLTCLRSQPWEYGDIPADYVMGGTTCALYLSLKYHRLHPEYVYTRIRNLQGKYNLRILLTLVDIPNHEDSLRELSKTSMVNKVTVMLCWSAPEAALYLEMYNSSENSGFASIMGRQSSGYVEHFYDFVTTPHSINKADAVALISSFGSLRKAINADGERISRVAGFGDVKVNRWCDAVEEPFLPRWASRRKAGDLAVTPADHPGENTDVGDGNGPGDADADAGAVPTGGDGGQSKPASDGDGLAPGVAAALARLRENE